MSDDTTKDPQYISVYSRAQAIADGDLIDVSSAARETRIKYPVALTRAAWHACVEVPEGVTGQDERGRLHDVLFMLAVTARNSEGSSIAFQVLVKSSDATPPALVSLKALCTPGETPDPVITVLLDDEAE